MSSLLLKSKLSVSHLHRYCSLGRVQLVVYNDFAHWLLSLMNTASKIITDFICVRSLAISYRDGVIVAI